MGWVLILIGAVLSLGGAGRAFYIGGKALSENPDPASPERNAPRYVKPALHAVVVALAGIALIIAGAVWLVVDLVAAALG